MLKISANRRFLVHNDGTPFFYLADTAWELFHRLSLEDADVYLHDRAAKGFTVIQAVALAEYDGLHVPNAVGDLPLFDDDPTRPNEAYFEHMDEIIGRAESLGLYIGLLPTWGDKWNRKWGVGPEIFTPENAYAYGLWLGQRYADAPIIWILGGDRLIESDAHREVIAAMAAGLREGDGGTHLITFHPQGQHTSSEYFHEQDWLDFNMLQSGHTRNRDNWRMITNDYQMLPTKPCMDAEPGYEDHPADFKLDNGYLDEYDVRKALYWALFAGAHGHTYGCHPIWQFWSPRYRPAGFARREWREALQLPGAGHVRHACSLLRSRPFLSRIPDQALIISDESDQSRHVRATRDQSGSYALIYLPFYTAITIDLERLSGNTLIAYWYNPRTGVAMHSAHVPKQGQYSFEPPMGGPDWVLVLDDADQHYPIPGTQTYFERED
ncbi:MAG: glycoside hydrolase family 140 protein [Roseiflexaceae bacterium]|nr:glycoside hydrolase family 140 protein [Roseiflexaceae bacterium]